MKNANALLFFVVCAIFIVACGDDSGTQAGGIKDKSIHGVCQKGPFVVGSSVKLYELDTKTLGQTGKNFTGKIISDKGEFTMGDINLESPYVLLEASGYFRNEVGGEKSNGVITLNAVTDLSNREMINVNLLTHLEYERVLKLIEKGIGVSAAKIQAEKELFEAFGIQGKFLNSENLSIFGDSEGSAALFAVSILLLGNLNEAEFMERLTLFAMDFSENGNWNDEKTKAEIADWAMRTDLSNSLETIRNNVSSWNLGIVPLFENHVRNFWYMNYGLGLCSLEKEGFVVADTNRNSVNYGTQERFVCKSGKWVQASDFEKDTYGWNETSDGLVKKGNVSELYYKYDAKQKKWFETDENEVRLMSGCTESRIGEIAKDAESEEYYCSAGGWVGLNEWNWDVPKSVRFNPETSYDSLVDKRDGKIYKTVKIGSQIWMAENLRYAGVGYCDVGDEERCEIVGHNYDWLDAIDSIALANDSLNPETCDYSKSCLLPQTVRGVCPEGWHLPDSTDWAILFEIAGGSSVAGMTLKSARGGWLNNGTDLFGFSVIPVDNSWHEFDFKSGSYAEFWVAGNSVTCEILGKAPNDSGCSNWSGGLVVGFYQENEVRFGYDNKDVGYSVRCLKDD